MLTYLDYLKLDYFINPRFESVNNYCVLLFEDYPHRVRHTNKTHFYEKKDCNTILIDKTFHYQPKK